MADEQNNAPRRSTRAQKPEKNTSPKTESGKQTGSGTVNKGSKKAPPESVNGGAGQGTGKSSPLNARNERPGKKENGETPNKSTRGGGAEKPAPNPNDKAAKPDESADKPDNKDSKEKAGDTAGATDDKSKAGAAAAGAADKAKSEAKGSNATGVDYSDKGMKDQLEHQAADVAMDATPVLGQINSARKALKNANKKKKEMSGDDDSNDLLDKTEEVADKAVDGGIKGVKVAVGGAAAGSMGFAAASMLMLMKTLMFLKGMAFGIAGKIAGFFAGAFQAVSSFITGALGVTAAVGNAIASGAIAVTVAFASLVGVVAVDTLTIKDPSDMACLPEQKAVDSGSQDYVGIGGDVALLQEENAGKLWSVYSEMGASKEQTAAVLGNLQHESGLDPTSVETIYDEAYMIGPKKVAATAADFDIHAIDSEYANKFPAIERAGIGLAQWTNGRNSLLINYAKDSGSNWHEFDTQISFMFAGDESNRQEQLKDFLASAPSTFDVETERFMNTWIGLSSPNNSLADRQMQATNYMMILERATADTAYAEGILSGLNVNRGSGNAAAGAYFHDDGCGQPLAAHYAGDKAEDGTGEVPAGLALVPWTRETLPPSLKEFAADPELAGLSWGDSAGWASNIYPGQCVALASSYFMQLYPEWNKGGRPVARPTGNGKFTAGGWASHYGALTTTAPSTGAVFSNSTSSVYGHTGIVQHVFANGDILIAEQNVRGASGDANGQQYSWNWRVIKTDRYQQDNWTFFKPADAEPRWQTTSA